MPRLSAVGISVLQGGEDVNDQANREAQMLAEWTRSAIDAAVYAGLVTLPWHPAEYVYGTLHGYYLAGLTPVDAAEALFAVRH